MAAGVPIEGRALDYAVRAVKLFRFLKARKDDVASIVGRQYLRAATSIGANLVEARAGESKADFVHKCAIAQKEAREALYWLKLMQRVDLVSPEKLGPLIQETDEILSVVTAIIRNTKANAKKR